MCGWGGAANPLVSRDDTNFSGGQSKSRDSHQVKLNVHGMCLPFAC